MAEQGKGGGFSHKGAQAGHEAFVEFLGRGALRKDAHRFSRADIYVVGMRGAGLDAGIVLEGPEMQETCCSPGYRQIGLGIVERVGQVSILPVGDIFKNPIPNRRGFREATIEKNKIHRRSIP